MTFRFNNNEFFLFNKLVNNRKENETTLEQNSYAVENAVVNCKISVVSQIYLTVYSVNFMLQTAKPPKSNFSLEM